MSNEISMDEAWNKEWNTAREVAQSIIEKWNTSDSPALYVMIADALMNARAEGWQSAFDAWIGSDAQNATALRADLESETRWAKQYHDDWIAAREELSQMKNGRDALAAEREQLLDHIASLVRAALKIEAALGVAINQRNEAERFANENYDLIGYWRDLFKCANAAKRKARRMRGCCGRMG